MRRLDVTRKAIFMQRDHYDRKRSKASRWCSDFDLDLSNEITETGFALHCLLSICADSLDVTREAIFMRRDHQTTQKEARQVAGVRTLIWTCRMSRERGAELLFEEFSDLS
jgi:hypothetical protein